MPAADNAQSLLTIPVAVAELLAGAAARKGASLVVGKAASENVGAYAIYANEQQQCWMVELHMWDRYDKPFA